MHLYSFNPSVRTPLSIINYSLNQHFIISLVHTYSSVTGLTADPSLQPPQKTSTNSLIEVSKIILIIKHCHPDFGNIPFQPSPTFGGELWVATIFFLGGTWWDVALLLCLEPHKPFRGHEAQVWSVHSALRALRTACTTKHR